MQQIHVLNGPNLNMLGVREPEIYGHGTLSDLEDAIRSKASSEQSITFRQTNYEGQLVEWLHEAYEAGADVILNPGALTHYSYAVRDAATIVVDRNRLIEVHLSNPHAREAFRHKSVVTEIASGVIAGFGFDSYFLALQALTPSAAPLA